MHKALNVPTATGKFSQTDLDAEHKIEALRKIAQDRIHQILSGPLEAIRAIVR